MIYLFVHVLFIMLICVLIYNTMAPTVRYNFIFSLNRAALKNSTLLNCVYPVLLFLCMCLMFAQISLNFSPVMFAEIIPCCNVIS